jgi:hypothetical protein
MQTPGGPRPEVLTIGVYVDDLACVYLHDDEHSLYHAFAAKLREWDVEDEGELSDLCRDTLKVSLFGHKTLKKCLAAGKKC